MQGQLMPDDFFGRSRRLAESNSASHTGLLILESNLEQAIAIRAELSKLGFDPRNCFTFDVALQCIDRGECSFAVLNANFDRGAGRTLAAHLSQRQLRYVLLAEAPCPVDPLWLGASRVLPIPYAMPQLVAAVGCVCHG